ncbi:MAG: caspase family protein [Spirochaetales bacterium]|jgi:hypothetical protein|nr:caspase family protein [Spirochaetales bacterium]
MKKSISALILCTLLLCSAAFADTAGDAENTTRRFGLFAGSNNGGAGRVTLRYAVSDARSVAKVFAEMGGIRPEDSLLLVEPAARDITRQIDALAEKILAAKKSHKRTELVFYYSGHSDEEGLLLNAEKYTYKSLREHINSIQSDMRIVILDSCASGAFTRLKGGSKTQPFLIDTSVSAEGYAFLTSSSAAESSQESDAIRSSYFTHSLVAGLRGAADSVGDGRVTLNEVYRFAYSETLAKTEISKYGAQHPSYDMQVSGSGDVILTDIKQTSASLLIDAEITGKLSIRDGSDFLVAEITKSASRPMELGLEPGVYRITLQSGGDFFQATVSLAEDRRDALSQADFRIVRGTPAVSRGDTQEANNEHPYFPLGFQLFPSVGTAKADNDILIGFPLASGYDLDAFGIGLLGLITNGEVSGAQVSGLFNTVDKDFAGLQVAGIFDIVNGDVFGAQFAGIFNTVGGNVKGVQAANIFNYTHGSFTGAQLGSIFNIAGHEAKGVQAAAIFNYAGGDSTGAQIAVITNYTGGDFTGAQIGILNIAASEISGAQIGLVNWGGGGSSYIQQIGLVNISDNENAVPIGLINIVKNGMFHPLVWYDTMNFLNVGLKSGSKNIYTLLAFGTRQISLGREYGLGAGDRHGEDLLVTRVGLGYEMSLGQCYLDFDILAGTMFDDNSSKDNVSSSQLFQARLSFGFKAFDHLAAFAGVSYDYLLRLSSTSPDPQARLGLFNFPWSDSKNIHRLGLFGGVQF